MGTLLFLGIGVQEIILIALLVLLFFGGKKIPEMMRGLGKGVKSFKEGINGTEETKEDKENKEDKEQKETSNSDTGKE
jgi:sec-independent protein translocase protein TatA